MSLTMLDKRICFLMGHPWLERKIEKIFTSGDLFHCIVRAVTGGLLCGWHGAGHCESSHDCNMLPALRELSGRGDGRKAKEKQHSVTDISVEKRQGWNGGSDEFCLTRK